MLKQKHIAYSKERKRRCENQILEKFKVQSFLLVKIHIQYIRRWHTYIKSLTCTLNLYRGIKTQNLHKNTAYFHWGPQDKNSIRRS